MVEGERSAADDGADAWVVRSRVCMECQAQLPDSATSPSVSPPTSPTAKPKQDVGVPAPFNF